MVHKHFYFVRNSFQLFSNIVYQIQQKRSRANVPKRFCILVYDMSLAS